MIALISDIERSMAKRFFFTLFSAIVLLFQSGCGPVIVTTQFEAPPYLRILDRPPVGKIGVISAQFVPEADFPKFSSDQADAAITGATTGAGLWGLFVVLSGCINVFAPATCPAVLPFVTAGAMVGAAASGDRAQTAIPALAPEDAHSAVTAAFRELDLQEALRARVIKHGHATNLDLVTVRHPGPKAADEIPSSAALRTEGIAMALEIAVLKAGMRRAAVFSPEISLVMTARARFIRVSNGEIVHEAQYRFMSQPMTATKWAENNAAGFLREINRAYEDLAEQIVDRLFLVYEPPMPRGRGFLGHCVEAPLRPEYPTARLFCTPDCAMGLWGIWFPQVDSLQPMLRWESFPTAGDLEADQNKELQRIAEIGYELKLFQAVPYRAGLAGIVSWAPGELVYSRTLTSPNHRPETLLKACTRYYWTYRARFTLNGQPRATEWAGAYNAGLSECVPTYSSAPAPSRYYYIFTTPCPEASK